MIWMYLEWIWIMYETELFLNYIYFLIFCEDLYKKKCVCIFVTFMNPANYLVEKMHDTWMNPHFDSVFWLNVFQIQFVQQYWKVKILYEIYEFCWILLKRKYYMTNCLQENYCWIFLEEISVKSCVVKFWLEVNINQKKYSPHRCGERPRRER